MTTQTTAPGRIRVLNPVGEVQARSVAPVPRQPDLAGKIVGFLDNRKANADVLFASIGELLRERYGAAGVVHRQKDYAAIGAPPELIADLAERCDVVIAGTGD